MPTLRSRKTFVLFRVPAFRNFVTVCVAVHLALILCKSVARYINFMHALQIDSSTRQRENKFSFTFSLEIPSKSLRYPISSIFLCKDANPRRDKNFVSHVETLRGETTVENRKNRFFSFSHFPKDRRFKNALSKFYEKFVKLTEI